jgi:hypothetical protein
MKRRGKGKCEGKQNQGETKLRRNKIKGKQIEGKQNGGKRKCKRKGREMQGEMKRRGKGKCEGK